MFWLLTSMLWSYEVLQLEVDSGTDAKYKVVPFLTIVNSWKLLTILTKNSILDFRPVQDPPLATLPSRIDVTSRQLIFWEFSTNNCYFSHNNYQKWPKLCTTTLILGTTFIKIKNQVFQLPTTLLFQPPHHSKLENVFDFHYVHGKINLSRVE